MNIIERTQYSADGGKTWSDTEREAMAERVHSDLMEVMSIGEADIVLNAIEANPDALIQAMRDMDALPKVNEDWAAYINSDVGAAFKRGSEQAIDRAVTSENGIEYKGRLYAVIPVEQHATEEAALAKIKDWASNGAVYDTQRSARNWCDAHCINWEDN